MSARTKRLVFLWGAVTALPGIALMVALTAWRHDHGRLLDGSDVALQKAGYGTNCGGPAAPFESLFRHLPAKWCGLIHWRPCSERTTTITSQFPISNHERPWPGFATSPAPIFTFWLSFSNPNARPSSLPSPFAYAIADEKGFESPMFYTGRYGSYGPGGFGNRAGHVFTTAIFPHRSRKFFLRLYQQAGNRERIRIAEFPVTNAGVPDSCHWQPETLPSERHTNGFTFALSKAEVGVNPPGPRTTNGFSPSWQTQWGQWSEFRFCVSAQGRRSPGWSVNKMIVSDEQGSELPVYFPHWEFRCVEGDEIVCLHRWPYWTDQPAWKVTVHFEHSTNNGCWMEYLVRPRFLHPSGEQTAAPNGGPATQLGNLGITGGHHR